MRSIGGDDDGEGGGRGGDGEGGETTHTHIRTSCTYGDCLDRHLNAHSMHVVPLTLGCLHATHVHVV